MRCIGIEKQLHAGSDAGSGIEQLMRERTLPARGGLKANCRAARDNLNGSANLVEQCCDIQGGSAGSHDHYAAPFESGEIAVRRAVADSLFGKRPQNRRQIWVVADPDRNHYAASQNLFAVFELQLEADRRFM